MIVCWCFVVSTSPRYSELVAGKRRPGRPSNSDSLIRTPPKVVLIS